MANLLNIDAEIGADLIGDDAQPTLALRNTSTGPGLRAFGLVLTSTASIDQIAGEPTVTSAATTGTNLTLSKTVLGTASTAMLSLQVASVASGPAIDLTGTSFVSVTTIQATTGGVAGTGALRVRLTDNDTFGWIPIYPDAAVTAAVVE